MVDYREIRFERESLAESLPSPEEFVDAQIEFLEQRLAELKAAQNHARAEGYDIHGLNT